MCTTPATDLTQLELTQLREALRLDRAIKRQLLRQANEAISFSPLNEILGRKFDG
jgi:hypothetical protein